MKEYVRRSTAYGVIFTCMILMLASLCSSAAFASIGVSFHGRLQAPDGTAVAGSVDFKIQIVSPGAESCVLWEQTQTQTLDSGLFALELNGSGSTRTDGEAHSFTDTFSNSNAFNVGSTHCASGYSAYNPSSGDARLLRMSFNDGSGWEQAPDQSVNYVPFAANAYAVDGFPVTSLLRVADSGVPGNFVPLTSTQYTDLLSLIAGTSSKYAAAGSSTSGTIIYSQAGSLSGATVGSMWLDTTGGTDVLKIKTDSGIATIAQSVAGNFVTSVSTGTGLTGGPITSSGTVSIAPGGVTATELAGGAVGSTALDPAINIATTGHINATAVSTRSLALINAQPTPSSVTLSVPTAAFTNYNLVLPQAPPANNQTLVSDSAGHLSWSNQVGIGGSAPYAAGEVLRYDGTSLYQPAFLSMADIRSTVTPGATIFPATGCAASKTLSWSSLTDTFGCQDIHISSTQVAGLGATTWTTTGANISNANAGNVGIGTTAPTSALEINAQTLAVDGSGANAGEIHLSAAPANGSTFVGFRGPSAAPASSFLWNLPSSDGTTGQVLTTDGSANLVWASPSGVTSQWTTNGTAINYMTGKVGIGTTAPSSALEVAGNIKSTSGGFTFPDGTTMTSAAATATGITNITDLNFAADTDTNGSGDIIFSTHGSEKMRITNAGLVGIGATAPTNTLSFGGTAARKLWMERHTTANTAGNTLTIQAGGATLGATDKNGGGLSLSAGTATGTGSSTISFLTAKAQATTNTTDNAPAARLTITGSGNVGVNTTAPFAPLQVNSTVASASIGAMPFTTATNFATGYVGFNTHTDTSTFKTYTDTAHNGGGLIYANVYGEMDFVTIPNTGGTSQSLTQAQMVADVHLKVNTGGISTLSASTAATTVGITNSDTGGKSYVLSSTGSANAAGAGNLLITNTSDGVSILAASSGGNVGIGTTTPAYKLDVNGDINIAAGSKLYLNATPLCDSTGCTASPSDLRYKKNITSLHGALESIERLQGVSYEWIDKNRFSDKRQIGFIAQDVEKVYPEVVKTDLVSGMKSVMYDKLVAPLVESVKELAQNRADTDARVQKLEAENAALRARIDKIESRLEAEKTQ